MAGRARRTVRLGEAQRHVRPALGGRPGSRLASRLATRPAVTRSCGWSGAGGCACAGDAPSARGRRLRRPRPAVRHHPGRLERPETLDLLPDREAATLGARLRARPGVEIIARDRAGEAVAAEATAAAPPPPPTKLERHRRARHADRDARICRGDRAGAGRGPKAIARQTGLSRDTVRRWLHGKHRRTGARASAPASSDPHVPYLRERIGQGCRNAARLWGEIRERGYPGQVVPVRAWVRRLEAELSGAAASDGGPGMAAPDTTRCGPAAARRREARRHGHGLRRRAVDRAGGGRGGRSRPRIVAMVRGKDGARLPPLAGRGARRSAWPGSQRGSGATGRRWKRRCGCPGAPGRSKAGSPS